MKSKTTGIKGSPALTKAEFFANEKTMVDRAYSLLPENEGPAIVEIFRRRFASTYDPKIEHLSRPCFLPVIKYITETQPAASCHFLLFGYEKPIELYGRPKADLNCYLKLPPEQRSDILEHLRQNQIVIQNPFCLIQWRLYEAAASNGYAESVLHRFPNANPASKRILQRLAEGKLDPAQPMTAYPELDQFTGWFPVLVHYCNRFDLSVDYLLFQDYSEMALLDGRVLTPEEKEFIRAYSMTDSKAQEYVRLQMVLHYLDKN